MTDTPHECRSPMKHERDAGDKLLARLDGAAKNEAAARIREMEAALADGSFYKETDIDALQARAEAVQADAEQWARRCAIADDRAEAADAEVVRLRKQIDKSDANLKHSMDSNERLVTEVDRPKRERGVALAGVVTVKPLVFNAKDVAVGIGCRYLLAHDYNGWRYFQTSLGGVLENVSNRPFREKPDVIAAAQVDYDARIRAALAVAPAPYMTDLMTDPEKLDAFMEANPLPAPSPADGWMPMHDAPRDGTWFRARTEHGQERVVHFDDEYDRFPISHDGVCWSTAPIEWSPIEARDDLPPPLPAPSPGVWHQGEPPKPWRQEWFIAQTIHGDRVVLRALPEEYTYDYTTADHTYMIAGNIVCWMQFPDSSFVAPAPPHSVP